MNSNEAYRIALERLRKVLSTYTKDEELRDLISAQNDVQTRFQPMFTPEGIDALTAKDFREFLLFRNNRHWTGLQRMGPGITADMEALKKALHLLIDEGIPVEDRLDQLLPRGKAKVMKLGKAVLTPILMINRPDLYSVWNGTSEGAIREIGLWPDFERGLSTGLRYKQMNDLLRRVREDLGTDFWTLDALWWRVLRPADTATDEGDGSIFEEESGDSIAFGLERHLHDFLMDNWESTDLGREWDLLEDGGDIKGYGYERPTPVGRIDLLAKHKTEPRLLVIELKRDQTSDATVGQVMRYMGWVKAELATEQESVEGLIIALQKDKKLQYALTVAPHVNFMRYEVDFRLLDGEV